MAKIIYFGNEQLAQGIKAKTPIFDALLDNDYEIVALILPTANTRKPFPIDLKAKANHIPVHYTKDTSEILNIINQTQPDIGVLAAFSKFIPTSILEAIPNGIINIHPSLLPKYRGTTPIESALLNGDELAGVSVMRLVKAMDAGPTYAQGEVKITDQTTKQSLYEHLSNLGAKLLIDVLPGILAKQPLRASKTTHERLLPLHSINHSAYSKLTLRAHRSSSAKSKLLPVFQNLS